MENAKDTIVAKAKRAMLCLTRQCWEQGIAAHALMDEGDYGRLAIVVHDIVTRQSADGRLCNIENTPAVVDSSFCMEPVLFMGRRLKRDDYLAAVDKNINYLLNEAEKTADGVLYHIMGKEEIWADSAAFFPAALAMTGRVDDGIKQMQGILGRLRDEETGLYYHMWDEKRQKYNRKVLWGVGNGWIITGLLRLHGALPKERRAEREKLKSELNAFLSTMLSFKNGDGLFYDDMNDPKSYVETESAEMVAYTIYRGVLEGVIPADYLAEADNMRLAIRKKIGENGLVTDCAGSPDFLRPGTSAEGQAHFLMMENSRRKLVDSGRL